MIALVTGAAVGIGRAIAERLEAEGLRVWRADIQGDPPVDVTDETALRALIAEAQPDVLVNCAGGIPVSASELEVLDLNLRSAFVATQLALEQGAGVIVHISSVAGIEDIPHSSPAKAGLIRLTTAYGGPARMNCIVPGWIATPRGLREAAAMTPAERDAAGPMVSMEAITDAVIDLIRDDTARGRVVLLKGDSPL
jgi:NAD(P)-dependent dehydrogenase (short-subunit alcohol dehydrogenase family)